MAHISIPGGADAGLVRVTGISYYLPLKHKSAMALFLHLQVPPIPNLVWLIFNLEFALRMQFE